MTPRERAEHIVKEYFGSLLDWESSRLTSAITTAIQAASNEGVSLARGKQLPWIMDEIVALTKRAWPEDAPGSRVTQKNQSCRITEEHGELLSELRSLHGRRLSPEKRGSKEKVREEVGDLLFATLKMAWACEVDPVEALDVAMAKVRRRVEAVEARNETEQA